MGAHEVLREDEKKGDVPTLGLACSGDVVGRGGGGGGRGERSAEGGWGGEAEEGRGGGGSPTRRGGGGWENDGGEVEKAPEATRRIKPESYATLIVTVQSIRSVYIPAPTHAHARQYSFIVPVRLCPGQSSPPI